MLSSRLYLPVSTSLRKILKNWIKFVTSLLSCKWQGEFWAMLLENSCTCSEKMQYFVNGMVSHILNLVTSIVHSKLLKYYFCLQLVSLVS